MPAREKVEGEVGGVHPARRRPGEDGIQPVRHPGERLVVAVERRGEGPGDTGETAVPVCAGGDEVGGVVPDEAVVERRSVGPEGGGVPGTTGRSGVDGR